MTEHLPFRITVRDAKFIDSTEYTCYCPMYECTASITKAVSNEVLNSSVFDMDEYVNREVSEIIYRHLEEDHDLWRKDSAVAEYKREFRKWVLQPPNIQSAWTG